MNVLFICTSNKDRSPALEKYFKFMYPKHEYRSAGVNKYFCEKKSTHYVKYDDLYVWADLIVCAEKIHIEILERDFDLDFKMRVYNDNRKLAGKMLLGHTYLGIGDYTKGDISDDYLLKAESILWDTLKLNDAKN